MSNGYNLTKLSIPYLPYIAVRQMKDVLDDMKRRGFDPVIEKVWSIQQGATYGVSVLWNRLDAGSKTLYWYDYHKRGWIAGRKSAGKGRVRVSS